MAHDALDAHARDELGISDALKARPVQAAIASTASFSLGAAMRMLVAFAVPFSILPGTAAVAALAALAVLGGLAAGVGALFSLVA
jgi:hypothetical protein